MKKRIDIFILVVAAVVFLNGLLWAFSVPFNGAPDEYDHYRLAQFIADHNRIPVFVKDQDFYFSSIWTRLPLTPELLAYHQQNKEMFKNAFLYELKPPYMMWPCGPYLLFGLFMKLAKVFTMIPSFYFARFFSVLCGMILVFLVYDIARRLKPKDKLFQKTAVFLTACLPQFTFLTSYINPDIVTALVATLILRFWFFCLDAKWSMASAVWLGVGLGLGVLSKISGYVMLLMTGIFLASFASQIKNRRKYFGAVLISCAAISGWFFIRNYVLYHDALGYGAYTRHLAEFLRQAPAFIVDHDIFSIVKDFHYDSQALPYLIHFCFSSFVGVFGWLAIALPGIFYYVFYGLLATGFIGFAFRFEGVKQKTSEGRIFFLIFLSVFLQVAVIIAYVIFIRYQPQGRYFYPVIGPIALVLSAGLLSLAKGERFRRIMFFTLGVFLVSLNIFSFLYCSALRYFVHPAF